MSIGVRLAAVMDNVYDRMRDPAAFRVRVEDAESATLEGLRGHKYVLLVSFRRNGEPVPSPVWAAVDGDGHLYAETSLDSAKVKRIRNNPNVLVAPATFRGKPTGMVVTGNARVLGADEWPHAEKTLESAFGFGRKLYQRAFPMSEQSRAYIEVCTAPPR